MNRIACALAALGMASVILPGCTTKTVYVEVPVEVKPTPTPKPRPKPVVRYDNPDNFDAVGKPTSYSGN